MVLEDLKKDLIECESRMAGLQRSIEQLQEEWLALKHERAELLKVLSAVEMVEEFCNEWQDRS